MTLYGTNEKVRAFDVLGGAKTIKTEIENEIDAHDFLMKGVPVAALFELIDQFVLLQTTDVLEKAIGMSTRTMQRKRKALDKAALSPDQGSKLWKFAEILSSAINVLGSQEAAEDWLNKPAIGLEYRKPIDLMASSAGAEAVEAYLTQMDYGVYI